MTHLDTRGVSRESQKEKKCGGVFGLENMAADRNELVPPASVRYRIRSNCRKFDGLEWTDAQT